MKNIKLILFCIFAVVSVAAPLSIIWKYEAVLRYGTTYKFRTAPIDPYDAFRGRYVVLGFADDQLDYVEAESMRLFFNDPAYLRLAIDDDGFAKPAEIRWFPLKGENVIRIDRVRENRRDRKSKLHIAYPFNRYYLPEDIAPLAEELYRRANRDANDDRKRDTYVTVKVYKGVGVLEELYLNGVPVREAIKTELAK